MLLINDKQILRKTGLLLLTSILLILSFLNSQTSILAWVAIVPLFYAIENASTKASFFIFYFFGIFFFGGILYWLTYVTKLGYVLFVLFLALFFGIFGLFTSIFFQKFKKSTLAFLLCLIIPALWGSIEFFKRIIFSGFKNSFHTPSPV